MRVLFVHNYYQFRGGEERSLDLLARQLTLAGHETRLFFRDSAALRRARWWQAPSLAAGSLFSVSAFSELRREIRAFSPDLIHVHNIYPLLSPSVYLAARVEGVPVVQTLHNYRSLCINGLFLRGGAPCELCLKGNALHGIAGRCYRGSAAQSFVMGAGQMVHRSLGTWHKSVDAFIALSEFSREKFIAGGFPPGKIHLAPNFVPVASRPFRPEHAGYLVYMGRLMEEKGLKTLLTAYKIFALRFPRVALHVAGEGPLREGLEDFKRSNPELAVRVHGWLADQERDELLGSAAAMVFPSVCYENCPYAVLDSLAAGVPVVASRLGGTRELVSEEKTGVFFQPGRPEDLARALESIFRDPGRLSAMRAAVRREAEARFDVPAGMARVLEIYGKVLPGGHRGRP